MSLNRRQFLRTTAILGGGLVIGFELNGCGEKKFAAVAAPESFQPNSYLEIKPTGEIILQLNRAEMGQGVYTSMPTLVAEELEVDPSAITLHYAPVHSDFADIETHMQLTGGSSSVKNSYELLRKVGATAKATLLDAAAKDWNVPAYTLVAENGKVRDPASKREIGYGGLVATAKTLPISKSVMLKSPDQFKLIGKFDRRLDAQQKVDGTSAFGIDVHRDNMVYAVLVRCPYFGGTLKKFDATNSKQINGVSDIFAIGNSVAIVANSYWPARKAAQALTIEWDKGPLAGLDSAGIRNLLKQQLNASGGHNVTDDGKAPSANTPNTNLKIIDAEYYAPYQAHAAMEPLNCVADVRADKVELWVGNQSPDMFRAIIAAALQRPRESVFVHTQMLGGGFGRRSYPDYAVEAALVSQKIGKPVKLIWSREDDMRHDYYRPASLSHLRAYLRDGELVGWENKIAGASVMQGFIPNGAKTFLPWLPESISHSISSVIAKRDFLSTEGASKLLYTTPHLKVDYAYCDPGVPVGSWRSVGNSLNGFFVEGFVDEIAQALEQDPLAFRLAHLKPEATRARAALELAAAKADWGNPPPGRFHGVSVHEAFNTVVAEIAEVSVEDSQINVHRVVCAVECGRAVNPDIVRAQIESGVIFALSAALTGEITIEDGAVKQSNFHDFEPIRMHNAPAVEVHIVPSEAPPTGVGEPGVPPLAAAVGNAIFAATGKRLRELPFKL